MTHAPIIVFGPPGVGKTTVLARARALHPDWCVLDEPLERAREFGVLDAVCRGDDPHAGLRMQLLMMHERAALAWAANARGGPLLVDGHAEIDCLVYAAVHYRRHIMDATDLKTLSRAIQQLTVPPWYELNAAAQLVYLRADADVCRRRIAARDRVEERSLDLDTCQLFVRQFDRTVEFLRVEERRAVITLDAGALNADTLCSNLTA